ncbi:MAG: radical SAM protein [Bdellovibrionota bacterium]
MSIIGDLQGRTAKHRIPVQASLELTHSCNQRCGHCYLASHNDSGKGCSPLGFEEWRRILDELSEEGTLFLTLIGGEAMLHPKFWQIARHCVTRNFAVSLITNGILIDDVVAERIAELNFFQVTLSLYSMDPAIHDKMTGVKGSYARTIAALDQLRLRKVPIGINCLLTKHNIDSCFELKQWAKQRDIRIQFSLLVTTRLDGAVEPALERASAEQIYRYFATLRKLDNQIRPAAVVAPNPTDPDSPVCNAGRGRCAIDPFGNLLACIDMRDQIGNLRERSFRELWNSPKALCLSGFINHDLKFNPRSKDGMFCSHCPAMADLEVGDKMAPVPFLMEIASIRRRIYECKTTN